MKNNGTKRKRHSSKHVKRGKMFKICLPAGPDFSGIGRLDPAVNFVSNSLMRSLVPARPPKSGPAGNLKSLKFLSTLQGGTA
jgi:hypothetical protein